MEIGDDTYQCPWCMEVIAHIKTRAETNGRRSISGALICPKCGRLVCQKSRFKKKSW